MNKEQLVKLIAEQQWNIEYHTGKLSDASALLELYTQTLAKLSANE